MPWTAASRKLPSGIFRGKRTGAHVARSALLIRQRFGEVSKDEDLSGATYRRLLGDPLQQVQRLLGHSSLATTYIYLDHLAGCHDTVDAAVEELLSGIETPLVLRGAA